MNEQINLARQARVPFKTNKGQAIDHVISVVDEVGGSYDFGGHSAEFLVFNSFSKTPTPEFTLDVDLSLGEMHITSDPITRKKEDFVYQLWITDATGFRQLWLNGPFWLYNRDVDAGENADTITISPSGDNLTLTVSLGSGALKTAVIEISSAEILDIHNTAVLGLPQPGVGMWNRVIDTTYYHVFGTTPYTRLNTAQLQLYYSTDRTSSLNMVAAGGMLTTSEDSISSSVESGGLSSRATSLLENRGVYIMSSASNQQFITGDGTLKVTMLYKTLTL